MSKNIPRLLSPVIFGGADVLDTMLKRMQDDFGRIASYGGSNECFVASSKGDYVPNYDVLKLKDTVEIRFSLPGIEKSQTDLEVTSKNLRLKVSDVKQHEGDVIVKGIKDVSNFELVLEWSFNINDEEVSAKFENGILQVSLPKREKSERECRKVEIG